jgi:neurofibromin 1
MLHFQNSSVSTSITNQYSNSLPPQNSSHNTSAWASVPQDHETEDLLAEWANMTGFLCALGSVWLPSKQPKPVLYMVVQQSVTEAATSPVPSPNSRRAKPIIETTTNTDLHYCPVTQFIGDLLKLLTWQNDKIGMQLQRHIQTLLGHELSTSCYPILFDQIKILVDKSFDLTGQVIISDQNTSFIENIIFIMKKVLEGKTDTNGENPLSTISIENLMINIVRYVRHLDSSNQVIQLKRRVCQLAQAILKRRDDLLFRQEMKFRNKLVEYLTDWIMGNTHQFNVQTNEITSVLNRDLDQASMEAVASILAGLPLQPEENDKGDMVEAKSQLFLKYFTLFMNLLNDCSEDFIESSNEYYNNRVVATSSQTLQALRNSTIVAMSNLLNANIESGLMRSIALGYHRDAQTRAAFMEVLTKILQQGTEFDTLAETVLADRFERLVDLMIMEGEKQEFPIMMALANVVNSEYMDDLSRVLVTIFDSKRLLSHLLTNMFMKEVEVADSYQILFRGNSLASKIMALCFKIYGTRYLMHVFQPILNNLFSNENIQKSYEVDPTRIEQNEDIEENRRNLCELTRVIFHSIMKSTKVFPLHLRVVCNCLYQVVSQRFLQNGFQAVSSVIFLRLINPVLISPQEYGIVEGEPPPKMKRGLTLMCKILQNLANNLVFTKEYYMKFFNDFLRSNFELVSNFIIDVTSKNLDISSELYLTQFISDANVLTLHRLLWLHQEKIGDYLSSSRDQKAVGRRPFDKMATLLAHLGTFFLDYNSIQRCQNQKDLHFYSPSNSY